MISVASVLTRHKNKSKFLKYSFYKVIVVLTGCLYFGTDIIVIISDYDVRLIGGSSRCSGRVEISYQGSWGGICSQQWDKSDAQVLCRQLGCGEPVMVFSEFGRSSGPIFLSELHCRGDENKLTDCGHSGWENAPCDDFPHTGIVCNETQWVNTEFPLIPESDSDQIEASSAAIKVKPASPLSVTGMYLSLFLLRR